MKSYTKLEIDSLLNQVFLCVGEVEFVRVVITTPDFSQIEWKGVRIFVFVTIILVVGQVEDFFFDIEIGEGTEVEWEEIWISVVVELATLPGTKTLGFKPTRDPSHGIDSQRNGEIFGLVVVAVGTAMELP